MTKSISDRLSSLLKADNNTCTRTLHVKKLFRFISWKTNPILEFIGVKSIKIQIFQVKRDVKILQRPI
jgi:hypothetical protein